MPFSSKSRGIAVPEMAVPAKNTLRPKGQDLESLLALPLIKWVDYRCRAEFIRPTGDCPRWSYTWMTGRDKTTDGRMNSTLQPEPQALVEKVRPAMVLLTDGKYFCENVDLPTQSGQESYVLWQLKTALE